MLTIVSNVVFIDDSTLALPRNIGYPYASNRNTLLPERPNEVLP